MNECAPRVLLVGAYPPPPGGNSVHVERLRALLAPEYDVAVADLYARAAVPGDPPGVLRCRPRSALDVARLFGIFGDPRNAIVHFHVSAMNAFALFGHALVRAVPRSARTILTIHSGSFVAASARAHPLRRATISALIRRFDRVVAVNAEQAAALELLGVPRERIAVIPAFLPAAAGAPPPELVRLRERVARLVVTSGYGVPHYGFTTLLDALDRFGAQSGVGGALFLYHTFDADHLRTLIPRLAAPDRVMFRDRPAAEFAAALPLADVYVRATDRDGDAVAIREAAAAGAKIVASDAVARPVGSLLFRTGDPDSLRAALALAFEDEAAGRVQVDAQDGASRLLALYHELAAPREALALA